jgi:hypothetical protein
MPDGQVDALSTRRFEKPSKAVPRQRSRFCGGIFQNTVPSGRRIRAKRLKPGVLKTLLIHVVVIPFRHLYLSLVSRSQQMPRFHFNVFNNVVALDYEGVERPSLEVARAEAVAGARDLVASHIRDGNTIYSSHRIEITDEAGRLLDVVRFGDIVDLRP